MGGTAPGAGPSGIPGIFFLLHIFSHTITLFIDGKGTTHKDKYKYTILTGKQFEETSENAQWRKVKQMQPM